MIRLQPGTTTLALTGAAGLDLTGATATVELSQGLGEAALLRREMAAVEAGPDGRWAAVRIDAADMRALPSGRYYLAVALALPSGVNGVADAIIQAAPARIEIGYAAPLSPAAAGTGGTVVCPSGQVLEIALSATGEQVLEISLPQTIINQDVSAAFSSSVSANSSNIAVLSGKILTNSSTIGVLSGQVSTNSSNISTNAAAISSHLANTGVHSLDALSQSSATDGQVATWSQSLGKWVASTISVVSAWARNAATGVVYLATSTDKLRIGGDGAADARVHGVALGNTSATYYEKIYASNGTTLLRSMRDDGAFSVGNGAATLSISWPDGYTARFSAAPYDIEFAGRTCFSSAFAAMNGSTAVSRAGLMFPRGFAESTARIGFTDTFIEGKPLDISGQGVNEGNFHGGRLGLSGGSGFGTGQKGAVCISVIQTAPRDAEMRNGDVALYVSGSGELIAKYKNASGVTSTSILGTELTA